jgi:carbamoylphosphate synthase small subunit
MSVGRPLATLVIPGNYFPGKLKGLPAAVEVSHVNLNDGTVEGLRHREEPLLTIQYHSEASPGPLDNMYLFERFLEMVAAQAVRGS